MGCAQPFLMANSVNLFYRVLLAVLQTGGRMKLQIEPLWEGVERGMEEAATGDVTTA